MSQLREDPFIVSISVKSILAYLERHLHSNHHQHLFHSPLDCTSSSEDWHRFIRSGLQTPLHLNLGIPGIEEPDHPIEENPECLHAACILGSETIPVILSGEIELALEEGLIDEQTMLNLRNIIRVTS